MSKLNDRLSKAARFVRQMRTSVTSPGARRVSGTLAKGGFWIVLLGLGITDIALLFPAGTQQTFRTLSKRTGGMQPLSQVLYAAAQIVPDHQNRTHTAPGSAVLGTVSQTQSGNETMQYNQTAAEYRAWQHVVQSHPDYRDGYVMCTILALRLNKEGEAKTYLSRLLELDPNYPLLPALQSNLTDN